jgi:chlorite dismutase
MSEHTVFTSYPVFRARPEALSEADREVAVKEVQDLFDGWSDRVQVRGVYSLTGFRADADLMFWWVAESAEELQDLLVTFRRTRLGRALVHQDQFLGLVRPAEFARDHLPAFIKGDEPKLYISVYPFVRTTDWYLLPAEERGKYLREHGEEGRRFSDVLANTTSAFGLGDYEWILCFEADGFDRIVDLLRALRAVEARRYTKLETPFYAGIRKDLAGAVQDLP